MDSYKLWSHLSNNANIIDVKLSRVPFSFFDIFAVVIVVVIFIAWQTFVLFATFFSHILQVGVLPLRPAVVVVISLLPRYGSIVIAINEFVVVIVLVHPTRLAICS